MGENSKRDLSGLPPGVKSVKVVHIYKDYYPVLGGIENHLRLLAEGLVKRGLEVTVLVTSLTGQTTTLEMNGVRVIKAGRLVTLASTPLSLSLFLIVRRLKPDIAHLHFPYPWGELAHLWLGKARRTVITYHSDIVRQRNLLRFYKPFLWRLLAKADRIIASSDHYLKGSLYLSRHADKSTVIPYGIDLKRFTSPPADAGAIRKRHGSPLLLFVGRLRYYKGLQYLLEAMRDIEARLLIVGKGPMEKEWLNLATGLGLAKRVTFMGEVPEEELPLYYHACDIFVLPASERSEAFGIVQLEAMASGKPVVCTELGTGTSYVNIDGQTGLVVPPRDPAALAGAIERLLSDPGLREEMGQRARERVEKEFSHQRMIDSTLALYKEVLST